MNKFSNTSVKWTNSLVHKVEKFNNMSIKWTSSLLNKVDEVIKAGGSIRAKDKINMLKATGMEYHK